MVNFRLLQLGTFWTFPLMVLEMAITAVFYIYISFLNISSAWTNVYPWRNEPTAYDRHHTSYRRMRRFSSITFLHIFSPLSKERAGAVHESLIYTWASFGSFGSWHSGICLFFYHSLQINFRWRLSVFSMFTQPKITISGRGMWHFIIFFLLYCIPTGFR